MAANTPFDNTGRPYNISLVTLGNQHNLNTTAYDAYSPLFLPTNYVLTYLLSFALATAMITHTVLYHGPSIVDNVLRPDPADDDIHVKLMRQYPEGKFTFLFISMVIIFVFPVPNSWYAIGLVVFFSIGVLAVQVNFIQLL